jgi:vanadium chloroperoxidase
VAGAASTVLNKLYRNPAKREASVSNNTFLVLGQFLDKEIRGQIGSSGVDELSASFLFGVMVARAILQALELKADDPGTDTAGYVPKFPKPYYFGDDPSNPVRIRPFDPNNPAAGDQVQRPYHAPYYGKTARRFAVSMDHTIEEPPVVPADVARTYSGTRKAEYDDATKDVIRMGGLIGLPTTKRREDQSVAGLFWAYDGVTLIGTPPRLYNQIIRQIAYDNAKGSNIASDGNTADLVRLFALVNVALADAGIYAWREKYRFELWRPLPGVRNDPYQALPLWQVFGAPETNSNRQPFKPPFPVHPPYLPINETKCANGFDTGLPKRPRHIRRRSIPHGPTLLL